MGGKRDAQGLTSFEPPLYPCFDCCAPCKRDSTCQCARMEWPPPPPHMHGIPISWSVDDFPYSCIMFTLEN